MISADLSPEFWVKSIVGLFGSGGMGAILIQIFRRGRAKADVRDSRAPEIEAEAEKEKSDAQLLAALNGVAERWVDRAERKLQEAEDTITKLRRELHDLRNDLTRYRGMEVENERLKLRISTLETENADLRTRLAA